MFIFGHRDCYTVRTNRIEVTLHDMQLLDTISTWPSSLHVPAMILEWPGGGMVAGSSQSCSKATLRSECTGMCPWLERVSTGRSSLPAELSQTYPTGRSRLGWEGSLGPLSQIQQPRMCMFLTLMLSPVLPGLSLRTPLPEPLG